MKQSSIKERFEKTISILGLKPARTLVPLVSSRFFFVSSLLMMRPEIMHNKRETAGIGLM